MTDTAPGSSLNVALAKLQTQLPKITKDLRADVETKSGAKYQYNYADLAQISAELLPLLGNLGLSFTSRPTMRDNRFVLVYELRHISGEKDEGEWPLPAPGSASPQEIGSAITYGRRNALCAVTGLAPAEDDDAAVAQKAATNRRRRGSRTEQPAQQLGGTDGQQAPITGEQTVRLQKAFQALEISANADKAKYVFSVVGQKVTTSAELTQFDAARVIKQAEKDVAKRNQPQPAAAPESQPGAEAQASA